MLSPWPRSDVLRWWLDDSGYILISFTRANNLILS